MDQQCPRLSRSPRNDFGVTLGDVGQNKNALCIPVFHPDTSETKPHSKPRSNAVDSQLGVSFCRIACSIKERDG